MIDLDLQNKRVMIRCDLNVPMQNGQITNDQRLKRSIPTIQQALKKGASVLLLSHLGRPKEGQWEEGLSLKPIAVRLQDLMHYPVRFEKNWIEGVALAKGEVVLAENVRFEVGEKMNDPKLAKKMAALCDVFVMDAFATAHRSETSTVGVAEYAKVAAAGPLLIEELDALSKVMQAPKRPLLAIVGGSKVSSKLLVLKSLLNVVDALILGGGIANTFCKAKGIEVGKSLVEEDLVETAKSLLGDAAKKEVKIFLPVDAVVAKEMSENADSRVVSISSFTSSSKGEGGAKIEHSEMILDVGPDSLAKYREVIQSAGTILWNGPIGVFEMSPFSRGTAELCKMMANSKAFSVAGGGETLAALEQFGVEQDISYISTGGGAFLEVVEGKTLPAVAILEKRGAKRGVTG